MSFSLLLIYKRYFLIIRYSLNGLKISWETSKTLYQKQFEEVIIRNNKLQLYKIWILKLLNCFLD